MKPISMSTAKAMPPLLPASIIDCIIAPASMNWRKLWTGGKPGSSTPAPAPPVWTASSRVGKTTIGEISCGRRKVWRIERAPSARTTRAVVARSLTRGTGSSPPPSPSSFSRWWPVLATKTSSRVGRDQLQRLDRDPGLVEGADDAGDVGGAVLDLDQDPLAVLRRQQLADLGADALGLGDRALGQQQLDVWVADFVLQRLRRALGDDPAAVDDPDVVGQLVGLLEVLGGEEDGRAFFVQLPHLLPDRLAADRVEAGGRLVEEEDARFVDQRRGEVEAALHPARVGADPAVGGVAQADPVEQAVGALAPAGGRQPLQGRLQADQLAAGHQRVERRFLQGDADRGAHLARFGDDVVAGDAGPAAGRQQQRRQHPHRGRLAGAVGAEEAVDLALVDREVDPLHGEHLAERALQPLDDDRRHR